MKKDMPNHVKTFLKKNKITPMYNPDLKTPFVLFCNDNGKLFFLYNSKFLTINHRPLRLVVDNVCKKAI
jgi:hypothetical protein